MAYSAPPTVNTSDSWTASQHNTYLKDNMIALKALIDAMGTTLFPVGSIFISVSSTNPSTFLGGTWVAFGTGRTIVGIDAGQTEFDTVEETGGAKTHSLTSSENGAHTHSISTLPTSYDYSQVASLRLYCTSAFSRVTHQRSAPKSLSATVNKVPGVTFRSAMSCPPLIR